MARYEYYIRDHLGSIWLTYSDLNADGLITMPDEIVEEMHYYPFGMMMEGSWMGSSGQYGYNGIEYENFLDLEMNLATYRGLDPTLGRWGQVDPEAEALKSLSPYNSMGNNPISYVDPEGDLPFLAMGIAAVLHTVTHLATNNFTFNNWNWGVFTGSVVAGAVGGVVGSALEKAQIGGFLGGTILGGSTAFSHNFTSGIINKNLSLRSLVSQTLLGAGTGGLISGIEAEIRGYRFLDGRSKILTERFQFPLGGTPTTENSPNHMLGQKPMSVGDAIDRGEVGLIDRKVVDRVGTSNPDLRNINKGFEGELRLRGHAYVPEGREFYVSVDGKDVLRTTQGRIDTYIPSKGKNISWGYRGDAVQQITTLNGVSIGVTVRPNSYLYITGKHRGWDGFLFWGR